MEEYTIIGDPRGVRAKLLLAAKNTIECVKEYENFNTIQKQVSTLMNDINQNLLKIGGSLKSVEDYLPELKIKKEKKEMKKSIKPKQEKQTKKKVVKKPKKKLDMLSKELEEISRKLQEL